MHRLSLAGGLLLLAVTSPGHREAEAIRVQERGVHLDVSKSFFREAGRASRDLAVLAAAEHGASKGSLRVLDACAGSGSRGLRYFFDAGANEVLCNDAQEGSEETILRNFELNADRARGDRADGRFRASRNDALRLFHELHLERDFYDVVDIDTFSFNPTVIAGALHCVKHDGLLYVTMTDGMAAGGRVPVRTLERFGMWTAPHPGVNEAGLRYLIGFAMREAAAQNLMARPVFSLFAPHGPVFRAMIKLSKVDQDTTPRPSDFLAMYAHCQDCADGGVLRWEELGCAPPCRTCGGVRHTVTGPLYTGPLHDSAALESMRGRSAALGWEDTTALLDKLVEEAAPELPPFYFTTADVSRAIGASPPPMRKVISELQRRGFSAARSHVERDAIKTNASFRDITSAAGSVAGA